MTGGPQRLQRPPKPSSRGCANKLSPLLGASAARSSAAGNTSTRRANMRCIKVAMALRLIPTPTYVCKPSYKPLSADLAAGAKFTGNASVWSQQTRHVRPPTRICWRFAGKTVSAMESRAPKLLAKASSISRRQRNSPRPLMHSLDEYASLQGLWKMF